MVFNPTVHLPEGKALGAWSSSGGVSSDDFKNYFWVSPILKSIQLLPVLKAELAA